MSNQVRVESTENDETYVLIVPIDRVARSQAVVL